MERLVNKVDLLVKCEEILEGYDGIIPDLCNDMKQEISLTKVKIEELRNILSEQKDEISECKELLSRLNYTKEFICHINNNLPDRYNFKSCGTEHVQMYEVLEESCASSIHGDPMFWNGLSPDSAQIIVKQTTSSSCVIYFTHEEFDKIPQYLRGRMDYNTVNKFIDNFNATIKKKYEIFSRPRNNLRGKLLIAYDTFKKQETSETIEKGIYFCTADDLKTYGNIKMDKTAQNILNVLRNAQRIREMRSPGLVRYAVCA